MLRRGNSGQRHTADSALSYGLPGLQWTNPIWSHHLVILVLDDVTVPSELASRGEFQADPRDLTGICDDGVLPTVFFWSRRPFFARRQAGLCVESLPVHDLEEDLVDVHGVGIGGEVIDRPNFNIVGGGIFADRFMPLDGGDTLRQTDGEVNRAKGHIARKLLPCGGYRHCFQQGELSLRPAL